MKKLFVQFYLLLFVCFLVMTMLVGLVYKFTAERAGRQSLDDLMKSSLYLMRSELREIPPRDWSKTLKELDLNLSFDLHIEPISKCKLSESSMQHLRAGDIVALDDQYTFIQRIPRSHYVLSVGPVPYLYFLHEMRLLDVALMAFIAISLAFPVFIWMRPHWQDMLRIETAAQRFGEGHLSERIHFDSMSSFERLGVAFNQMADNINALIASKKQLIDGIAHELRTPLVRLRYRLEMSENLTEAESQALNRDIGQLEALIEELLTYARLDRPQTELSLTTPDFPAWISDHVEDIQMVNPQREVALATLTHGNYGALDMRLMERVLDNLVNNALRYSSQRVAVSLTLQGSRASLLVEDDGPGIAPEERERVFEPFVRLDPSRDRATGGCGLGLAIVHSIAQAMGGEVRCEASPLGGARFCFSWPVYHQLPDFTSA
ncbi:two-component system sensor histidine kinase RstB [Klebsiella pneumoniae]|uniref:two-component system sensor histidine kinase RstB n=1 Tax=Klebsiella pneumoniae TaxID=573 RepID=UPI0022438884|nr:two-component system sensor histidine kinase RstB [Klebsiella pneumoniae]